MNIPFTQKTSYYWKKLPQNNSTTVIMLIWYLKVKNFVLKLKFLRQNYLIYCNTVIFYTSGGGVDEVLVRLSLIGPRMPIRCAFHPAVQCQKFRYIHFGKKGVCQNITRTIFNIYTYAFNL